MLDIITLFYDLSIVLAGIVIYFNKSGSLSASPAIKDEYFREGDKGGEVNKQSLVVL